MDLVSSSRSATNGWLISRHIASIQADLRAQQGDRAARRTLWLRVCTLDDQAARLRRKERVLGLQSGELHADGGSCRRHPPRSSSLSSTAVLTLPPAMVARMASTIDSISGGRFGINIVSGWAKAEYDQMGLWPGDDYFGYRYAYSTEYVQIMKELWAKGPPISRASISRCRIAHMKPMPEHKIEIVAAGQSPTGMAFARHLRRL